MNQLYPIFIKLKGWLCLVVGGGQVAARKVETLIAHGASVLLVSPDVDPSIADLAQSSDKLSIAQRPYRCEDINGIMLVVAATSDESVNKMIASDAIEKKILYNVVDQPELCNFFIPSILERGDLTVAVSTGGACPSFAKHIRKHLNDAIGADTETVLEALKKIRVELRAIYPDDLQRRMDLMTRIVNSEIVEDPDGRSCDELLIEMRKWTS